MPLILPFSANSTVDKYCRRNSFVAIFTTLINHSPISFNANTQDIEAKYESTHTTLLLLAYSRTNSLITLVPCRPPVSSVAM